jgi:predicted adenine nucleotide alpha hydrolase (AANH) superfamily ATPase
MILNKDNLENMIDAGCIDEADRDEILKNQKIAKFLEGRESIMTYEKEAEEAKQIVKRLKKEFIDCDEYPPLTKWFKKILGEENETN